MGVKKLVLLPGDGIGPEVMAEAEKVIGWINDETDLSIETEGDLIGGVAYEAHGVPFADETLVS